MSDVETLAKEYAEGMMGIGEYKESWHYNDRVMYNNLRRAVIYGANKKAEQINNLEQALKDIALYNNGFIEYFRQHNYRLMYELWERVYGISTAYIKSQNK